MLLPIWLHEFEGRVDSNRQWFEGKGIFVTVFSSLYVYEGWAECRVTSGVTC